MIIICYNLLEIFFKGTKILPMAKCWPSVVADERNGWLRCFCLNSLIEKGRSSWQLGQKYQLGCNGMRRQLQVSGVSSFHHHDSWHLGNHPAILSLLHFLIFKSGPLILQFGCSMQRDGTEDHFATGPTGNCFSFFRLTIFSSGRYYTRDHFSCLLRVFQACKLRSISRDNRAKTSTFLQGKQ